MGIPVVTREYTPRACRNSRKPMRLPPRHEMRPDSPALHESNFLFPIKHIRSLDLLDWTLESPQEHCHKTRRTLMSPQKCKTNWCNFNNWCCEQDVWKMTAITGIFLVSARSGAMCTLSCSILASGLFELCCHLLSGLHLRCTALYYIYWILSGPLLQT